MKAIAIAGLALVLCGTACARGETYVPAHRTHDGSRVPPNVSTISGHAQPASLGARSRVAFAAGEPVATSPYLIPLFLNAKPLR